jgi:hypothetical protein
VRLASQFQGLTELKGERPVTVMAKGAVKVTLAGAVR